MPAIAVGGLPYFGRMLADELSTKGWHCRYVASAGRNPIAWAATAKSVASADLVYLIGGQIERWSRPDWLARMVRKPIVMHWVGSDVTYAFGAARRGRASPLLIRRPVHWTEVPWTAAELRPLGIHAEVMPLTSARLPSRPQPLPETFTVLTYLPDARPGFYGRETVLNLAAALRDVHFLVAGTYGVGWEATPNLEFLGWQRDMEPVYARSSVLLRLPEHDGLSFMVLEALAAGRYVIWNHPLVGAVEARDDTEALNFIQQLRDDHHAGRLTLNETGIRAVRERYAPERVRAEILNRFEAILGQVP